MTLDLDALDALYNAATQIPWVHSSPYHVLDDSGEPVAFTHGVTRHGKAEDTANAAFIAAIHNSWPDLLQRVRALEQENISLHAELQRVYQLVHLHAGKSRQFEQELAAITDTADFYCEQGRFSQTVPERVATALDAERDRAITAEKQVQELKQRVRVLEQENTRLKERNIVLFHEVRIQTERADEHDHFTEVAEQERDAAVAREQDTTTHYVSLLAALSVGIDAEPNGSFYHAVIDPDLVSIIKDEVAPYFERIGSRLAAVDAAKEQGE